MYSWPHSENSKGDLQLKAQKYLSQKSVIVGGTVNSLYKSRQKGGTNYCTRSIVNAWNSSVTFQFYHGMTLLFSTLHVTFTMIIYIGASQTRCKRTDVSIVWDNCTFN